MKKYQKEDPNEKWNRVPPKISNYSSEPEYVSALEFHIKVLREENLQLSQTLSHTRKEVNKLEEEFKTLLNEFTGFVKDVKGWERYRKSQLQLQKIMF